MKRHQDLRQAAVATVIALGTCSMTACGDAGGPGTSPATAGTDTSTTSPNAPRSSSVSLDATSDTDSSAKLPVDLPAAAREETKDGAVTFGKYYYEAVGEASHSGSTTDLATLGMDDCAPCSKVVSKIDEGAKKGQTRGRDPYALSKVRATKRPDEGFKVSMTVVVRAHQVYEKGTVIGDVEATSYTLTEHVVWDDYKWQIADLVTS